jgi:ssDNA-binding Zn-finger/Zn-ribbon topoisomerase 1
MKSLLSRLLLSASLILAAVINVYGQDENLSKETEECLGCHRELHPGLVASWEKSRHSRITPAAALLKEPTGRRVSADTIAGPLREVVVGCYECHALRTEHHADSFEHNGYQVNVIVSPDDCATCHSTEVTQYGRNIMSHAYANLVDNSLYRDFMAAINNNYHRNEKELLKGETDSRTEYESCLYCHGTKVEVKGMATKETGYGELEFPVLEGWPNQGVGRINPDGSRGACTSCHSRHEFSIEMARKPYTCSECHKGPDVPAYKVYEVSKHGNIFNSLGKNYNFDNVPWVVGKDFTAPTCAACHASLLVSPDQTVIAERTHQFNDRLSWRLFGVPYAHPHPVHADLKDVKNSIGLPLAVEMDGTPVAKYVIDKEEQQVRSKKMKAICTSCHTADWVEEHFRRLDNTIVRTNAITHEATKIIMDIWEKGYARGLPQSENIFDEEAERIWTSIWLFYANTTRFSSAMAGGGDYGVFADGRYQTTEQLYRLHKYLELNDRLEGKMPKN